MEIKKFGHQLEKSGPGSNWERNNDVLVEEHNILIGELLSDDHYDVFARYGYAKMLVRGNTDEEKSFWEDLYDKMQISRVGISKRKEFDKLISSFEKSGFNSDHPLPVDTRYEILDGSHRLACSAVFDVLPRVTIYDEKSHQYDLSWFLLSGFSREEIDKIEKERAYLLQRYRKEGEDNFTGIIWGAALEYWDGIIERLKIADLRRAFIVDFEDTIEGFIEESYIGDGMSDERIISKAKRLSSLSTKVGIVAINKEQDEIRRIKQEIRDEFSKYMTDYFFDSIIHIIDNKKFGQDILRKYDIKK